VAAPPAQKTLRFSELQAQVEQEAQLQRAAELKLQDAAVVPRSESP
jgi:hypothetical protein